MGGVILQTLAGKFGHPASMQDLRQASQSLRLRGSEIETMVTAYKYWRLIRTLSFTERLLFSRVNKIARLLCGAPGFILSTTEINPINPVISTFNGAPVVETGATTLHEESKIPHVPVRDLRPVDFEDASLANFFRRPVIVGSVDSDASTTLTCYQHFMLFHELIVS